MDAELLNGIFRFQYKLPSASQSEATCDVLVGHFRSFVETIEPVQAGGFAFTAKDGPKVPLYQVEERELGELKRACGVLGGRDEDAALKHGDVWIDKRFPEHGCSMQMEFPEPNPLRR